MAPKEVSKVGIFRNGKYLMGVRQDTGKWTEPGGHLKPGEDPTDGALREVKEETGITLSKNNLELLGTKVVKDDLIVHAFRSDLSKEPDISTAKDPDHEVFGWNWIPVKKGRLPKTVEENLHVPRNKNVLHFFLGFEKTAVARSILRSRHLREWVADVPNQAVQTLQQRQEERRAKRQKDSRSVQPR